RFDCVPVGVTALKELTWSGLVEVTDNGDRYMNNSKRNWMMNRITRRLSAVGVIVVLFSAIFYAVVHGQDVIQPATGRIDGTATKGESNGPPADKGVGK